MKRNKIIETLKDLSKRFLEDKIAGKEYARTAESIIMSNVELVPELEEFADFLAQYSPDRDIPELYSSKELKSKIKKTFKI
jgi:hypothetical protein